MNNYKTVPTNVLKHMLQDAYESAIVDCVLPEDELDDYAVILAEYKSREDVTTIEAF